MKEILFQYMQEKYGYDRYDVEHFLERVYKEKRIEYTDREIYLVDIHDDDEYTHLYLVEITNGAYVGDPNRYIDNYGVRVLYWNSTRAEDADAMTGSICRVLLNELGM